MLRSIQIKIVLIFLVLGIIIIGAMGYVNYANIENILQMSIENVPKYEKVIQGYQVQMINLTICTAIIFTLVCLLVGVFVTKKVISPISRLINNAKRITSGEEIETKELTVSRSQNEVDDLVNAFYIMTKELKENLNEVSRKKNQIETILLHMTDGIIAFDMDGKILLINPAATRILRLLPEDENFEKIFEKLDVNVNLEKIIYLENWTSTEEKVTIGDNHVHMFFAPLKNDDDTPAGVIVVIQDITEHVKLDNMRKEFVADVSHELKTPITSIMGYTDTLLEDEYDKETKDKFLTVIATEARRMAKLVTDLLSLSKYDNDEIRQEKTEFDLGELVKSCQDKVQIEIEKKKHTVECFVTANVPAVYADKDGVERVVLNILTNSIKYTLEGGSIKIYVGFVYNDAYIKIIDNGIGIPEEDLSRIFERFYRVDKARTREMGGTGLRLIYC
ncbi:MAG: cell wall metabolism sensor histidine kinase WalK [Clostridia bacterium]|nr:cell wall metabolism sensor histidine kinase WalK [Clostridia bacterium]